MARGNYSFQKRQREIAKKKKREEKLQRKLNKKNDIVQSDDAVKQDPAE